MADPPPAPTRVVTYRAPVRYLEIDQQGVVFNMWYLGYCDEAMSAFLAGSGLSYPELVAKGADFQLVHSEIDWHSSLRWGDEARIDVWPAAVGNTSFTMHFEVHGPEVRVATVDTVYVAVRTDGTGKCPIPPVLRDALGPPAPGSGPPR
jgi:acyl-CoA thioester hydrolase